MSELPPITPVLDLEAAVRQRYGEAAQERGYENTFGIDAREPDRGHLDLVQPYVQVPLAEAPPFPCNAGPLRRDPRETKGGDYQLTTEAGPVCKPGDWC